MIYGKKIHKIEDIYKGDGITSCKWCGGTGYMHTFSTRGTFYNDAPCVCEIGRKIIDDKLKEENSGKRNSQLE